MLVSWTNEVMSRERGRPKTLLYKSRSLEDWRCYQQKMEHRRSRFRNAIDEFSFVHTEFYILVVLSSKDVLQVVGKVRQQLKREGDLRLEN